MKKPFPLICLLVTWFVTIELPFVNGQSVTKFPTTTANVASGNSRIWTNPQGVISSNNGAATVSLAKSGVCNATKCYQSAALEATGFGFSLPANSTVVGVEATIRVKASLANSIKDLSIQKANWGNVIGSPTNRAKTSFIGTTYTVRTYGGPTDSWDSGLKWDWLTAPTYGLHISYKNLNTTSTATVSVDYVKIKIYYTNGARIMSQERHATVISDVMNVYPNPVTDNLNIRMESDLVNAEVKIFNLNGQLVYENNHVDLKANEPFQISVAALPKGIYLLQAISTENRFTKQIVRN